MGWSVQMQVVHRWKHVNALPEHIEEGMIRAGQMLLEEAYAEAKTITVSWGGKVYRAWRTGNLAESLGIAFKRHDNPNFGPMYRMRGDLIGSSWLPRMDAQGLSVLALATSCGYGHYVHWGTSKTPSRPFMTNVLYRNQNIVSDEVVKRVRAGGIL